jgi:hypothetical protein
MKKAYEPVPINAGITGFVLQMGLIAFAELTRRLFGLSKRSKTQVNETIGLTGENHEDVKSDSSSLSFPDRPKWDFPKLARFGEHPLSPQLIWKSMEGVNEPLANPWWALLMFFAISMLTPPVPEHQPPMDPATGSFYSFSPPAVVNGERNTVVGRRNHH